MCKISNGILTVHLISSGYGFVDFDSPAAAQKAVAALKTSGVQAQMAKVRAYDRFIWISDTCELLSNAAINYRMRESLWGKSAKYDFLTVCFMDKCLHIFNQCFTAESCRRMMSSVCVCVCCN